MRADGYRILVTGACGSIGSRLVQHFLAAGATVCAFDNSEDGLFKLDQNVGKIETDSRLKLFFGSVRDQGRLLTAMEGVDSVIHCAALKHVYLSEYNPFEAVNTNIIGVQNVINAALKNNVDKVLFTSSDKAVNPSSTMGATKLLGERLIVAANHHSGKHQTRFSSVRFGNVLDTNGSVLQIFKEKLASKEALPITDMEMTRYFITMDEAVSLCAFAFDQMVGGEIFVSNMMACRILDLAKAMSTEGDVDYAVIGMKAGEKRYEELVTDAEAERTKCLESHYIVIPDTLSIMPTAIGQNLVSKYGQYRTLSGALRSDRDKFYPIDEIRMLLKRIGVI